MKFEKAKRALAEARSIDEVKQVRDKAEALRLYVKQQGDGLEMQNDIAEIKLRAERRAGELLAEFERGKTGPKLPDRLSDNSEYRQALEDAELNERTARRWQTEAALPEETFEQHVAETKASQKELTSAGVYRLAQRHKQAQEREQTNDNALLYVPDGLFRTMVIDPPWPAQKILRDERPLQDTFDYPTMTLDEISKLPIADLADPDGCHIYLWTTHKYLPYSFKLFDGWGVKYECLMTWNKNVGFTPYSWMYDTEHVLFGRVGSLPLQKLGLRLSFSAKVTKHSEKPDIFYERVLEASPEPRLELFARKKRGGFEAWGNEV